MCSWDEEARRRARSETNCMEQQEGRLRLPAIALGIVVSVSLASAAEPPTAKQVIEKVLEHDFWGLSGAEVAAQALVKDKGGGTRNYVFSAISRKYQKYLTKSMVRFRGPPDLAGAGFLQIQKEAGDDERYIYLPDLRRSRRVAANQRSQAFMGTDFNFADMDRRDLREGKYQAGPDKKMAQFDCYQVVVQPLRKDSPYSKVEMVVRKKDYVPLELKMFDKAGIHLKTLTVLQIKTISGKPYITKSQMSNRRDQHSTVLVLNKIRPRDDIPDTEFTANKLQH